VSTRDVRGPTGPCASLWTPFFHDRIRSRTQGRMALRGGVNSATIMDGPVERIAAEVRERIWQLGRVGALSSCPVCAIISPCYPNAACQTITNLQSPISNLPSLYSLLPTPYSPPCVSSWLYWLPAPCTPHLHPRLRPPPSSLPPHSRPRQRRSPPRPQPLPRSRRWR
jgi:hypothetical protein